MSMAELLEQVGTLQKSLSADQDDKKIAGAAGEGGAGAGDGAGAGGAGAGDGAGDGDDDDDDDDDGAGGNGGAGGAPLAKSFTFKLEDGTEVEALDGVEMLKSFAAQLEATNKVAVDAGAAAAAAKDALATAEAGFTEVLKKSLQVMTEQGALIKSMQGELKGLASQGRGRRTVTTPADGGEALRKSLQVDKPSQGVPPQEFLTKCLSAQKEGRITFMDVATAEAAINNGSQVPQSIVSRVLV